MKRRTLKSLVLNKHKISELQLKKGGSDPFSTDTPTMSTCTCVSCRMSCRTLGGDSLEC